MRKQGTMNRERMEEKNMLGCLGGELYIICVSLYSDHFVYSNNHLSNG